MASKDEENEQGIHISEDGTVTDENGNKYKLITGNAKYEPINNEESSEVINLNGKRFRRVTNYSLEPKESVGEKFSKSVEKTGAVASKAFTNYARDKMDNFIQSMNGPMFETKDENAVLNDLKPNEARKLINSRNLNQLYHNLDNSFKKVGRDLDKIDYRKFTKQEIEDMYQMLTSEIKNEMVDRHTRKAREKMEKILDKLEK
jgi:hypothetical protein